LAAWFSCFIWQPEMGSWWSLSAAMFIDPTGIRYIARYKSFFIHFIPFCSQVCILLFCHIRLWSCDS
jgi:hypothetical protein